MYHKNDVCIDFSRIETRAGTEMGAARQRHYLTAAHGYAAGNAHSDNRLTAGTVLIGVVGAGLNVAHFHAAD